MKMNDSILCGYEDSRLVDYRKMSGDDPKTVAYEDLGKVKIDGVLKSNHYIDGRLMQTYTRGENHTLVIAATRLGKTTSCVIPLIDSFSKQKTKRSMVISDPKGELYRLLAAELKEQGYEVLLLNLRDYTHSELWNPLLPIFRLYRKAMALSDQVEVVKTKKGFRNRFMNVVYDDQEELDDAIDQMRSMMLADVDAEIDRLMYTLIPPDNANDQFWNDASRQWGKANLWAMLEDSNGRPGRTLITEDNFTLNTMFTIMGNLSDRCCYDNDGYFSDRGRQSKAYLEALSIIENSSTTRRCIIRCFEAKIIAIRNSTVRFLTRGSTFTMDQLTSDHPVAVFISYPDENKTYYQVISLFVQNAYNHLIQYADSQGNGKLEIPFYFMLDEFGNFPKIPDFETVISACGGRNIWFYLVLQSYAQLNNVYGNATAEIIRDNLNLHLFLGSNNPATLEEFSKECGLTTRVAPVSALNGDREEITYYNVETIPLVPRSMLSNLQPGECVITEANCGYVLFSRMERYFACKEYKHFKPSRESDYICSSNPLSQKYAYEFMIAEKDEEEDDDDDFADLF